MCGIIGIIGSRPLAKPLREIDVDRLKHRGPDDRGIYNDSYASLGHRRLSIIDLSSGGHQPMKSPDGRYVIAYNGEVYNYIEIKERLKAAGFSFTTHSDTEVVLQAYICWGEKCLQQFRGMFSLSIWDRQDKKLFMARDRCGEKPFIYFMDDHHFIFASEFKALVPLLPEMPHLNPSVVDMYMHYQYAPEPYTLLNGVHKLEAAHYAILDLQKWSLETREYWDLFSIQADSRLTKQDIRSELDRAVELTLRSDVPVGVALSAGIDSAGIAAIAAKKYDAPLEAFCVGYPGRPSYDERHEAQELAKVLGCHFNEVELATDQFTETFPDFAALLDEPVADIAAFGHHSIPKLCAQKNIKVLLTGIGGDEVFWGYDWCRTAVSVNQNRFYFQILANMLGPFMTVRSLYVLLFKFSRTHKVPRAFRDFCRKLLACVDQSTPDDQLIFMAVTGAPEFTKNVAVGKTWYGSAMRSIHENNAYIPTELQTSVTKKDIPIAIMHYLFKTWLVSNCLSLGDRVSMAVGVETRLPFLDVGLIEKVVAWRKCHPDHTNGQKAVLREILSDVLPEATVKRPKSGFVPPVIQWISSISERYGHCLTDGHLVEQGIVDPDAVKMIATDGMTSLSPHTVYRIVLLEMWYRSMAELYRNNKNVSLSSEMCA